MARLVKVARRDEIAPGQVKMVAIDGQVIALCNVEGAFYAVDNVCTHDYGPLSDGDLYGHAIECPRHGAQFDVRTGEVVMLPAMKPIATYEVKLEGEELAIVLP